MVVNLSDTKVSVLERQEKKYICVTIEGKTVGIYRFMDQVSMDEPVEVEPGDQITTILETF